MTDQLLPSLTRSERANIVTRADIRHALPKPEKSAAPSPAIAKLVLLLLDQFGGQNEGRAWPSVELLARCAASSPRTIQRAIGGLIDAGLVTYRDRNVRKRRQVSAREYQVRYDRLAELVPTPGDPANMAASSSFDPATSDSQIRPDCHFDPANMTPKTKTTGTKKREPNNNARVSSNGSRREAVLEELALADVVVEVTPALRRLGVAGSRITALVRQAGSRDRVIEALQLVAEAGPGVRNPAAYFARAIERPDWKPQARRKPTP